MLPGGGHEDGFRRHVGIGLNLNRTSVAESAAGDNKAHDREQMTVVIIIQGVGRGSKCGRHHKKGDGVRNSRV